MVQAIVLSILILLVLFGIPIALVLLGHRD